MRSTFSAKVEFNVFVSFEYIYNKIINGTHNIIQILHYLIKLFKVKTIIYTLIASN